MDFVTKLPRTQRSNDMIWVIVDRLTKSAHFLATKETVSLSILAELYLEEIVSRHEVQLSIVSDRDSRFVSNFGNSLQKSLGTRINLSTAYHPQTDGQKAGEKQFVDLELVQITSYKVAIARKKLKAARDRQKMYADPHRRPLNFEVGDHVYLKVSPWKGVIRFELPAELAGIHNTFNVCYLRKCKVDDEMQLVSLSNLRVGLNQKLVEEPVKIVNRKVTKLRKKEIHVYLTMTRLRWETEELMKARYPRLFNHDQIPRMKSL
ncbi:uncharacterized protein [Rutidosis leptorrhynchoides]|uniref:uncharacterized protein n=1 Tax=Rutidosis leptorrhynchoides TaxID=125765 RepID=UPI003A9A1638